MKKLFGFDELVFYQPYKVDTTRLSESGKENFFLSFTDSLKYLLEKFDVKKTDIVLLPDFYCPETIQEIDKYATTAFYRINPDLSVDKPSYFSQIKKHAPRMIINYNFTGFILTLKEKEVLKKLSKNSVLIDDCAHRILEPEDISFLTKNHFYIDSIRKYSPFLGSHLISSSRLPSTTAKNINTYKIKIMLLQTLLKIIEGLSIRFSSMFLYNISSNIFDKQDSMVGTYPIPTKGDFLSHFLWNKLDLRKIKSHKKELASIYYEYLTKRKIPFIKTINVSEKYLHNLIYYPLLVKSSAVNELINYLDGKKIYISRLWEAPKNSTSSIKQDLYDSLLILPLSYRLTVHDTKYIVKQISEFLYTYKKTKI